MKTAVLLVLLCSWLHCGRASLVLSPETCQYIRNIVQKFHQESGVGFSGVITPPSPNIGNADTRDEEFFFPHLIVWDPYALFPALFPPGSIQCPLCGTTTKFSYWNDGSLKTNQPRYIHDSINIVYLVSAVYVCANRHRLLAHDESVLTRFPSRHMVPFVLLSRTGFTKSLINLCTSLPVQGINFYNMETLIVEKRWEAWSQQTDILACHKKILGENIPHTDFWSSPFAVSPSNDVLSKCFLAQFLLNEQTYLREIASVPTGTAISFDHTFKIAANIGYLRVDGRWVHQYDSLFLVMNSEGKVVTWQLTKGTSFSQIESLLTSLCERSPILSTVYIDECCKLRQKIQAVFGKDVVVKLDVFHATQRITRTLHKRNPLFHQCTQELRLVFRQPGDSGTKRMADTPSPDVMTSNLNKFICKWKDVKDCTGSGVFSPETIVAGKNLQQHVSSSCLSDIPPGGGTNRNERFHHHINSLFGKSKMGILLAYALLSVVIYAHNSAEKRSSRLVSRPIAASPYRACSGPISAVGITPKSRCQESNDRWEVNISDSMMDMHQIVEIFLSSLEKYQVMKLVSTMGLSRLKSSLLQFIPVKSSITDPQAVNVTASAASPSIEQKLSEYGLQLKAVIGDGNCFFRAVSLNILRESEAWACNLKLLGIDTQTMSVDTVTKALRQLFVNELLGERRSQYEAFVEMGDVDYASEAEKFRSDGFFDSELGNTMPLALCTALQCCMIVFSRDQRTRNMYISPQLVVCEAVCFLVHSPDGPGHYDYAIPCYPFHCVPPQTRPIRCRCGVNSKGTSSTSCEPSPFYSTRCKCFKASRACTSLCGCRNCANPAGMRPQLAAVACRRKRKHDFQVDIPKSKRFAEDREEKISKGPWSDFETIVLNQLTTVLHSPTDEGITKMYNNVVYYSSTSFCFPSLPQNIVFRNKTVGEIANKKKFDSSHSLKNQ